MMRFGERMTFLQRVGNTLSLGFGKVFIPMMSQGVELLLKERFGNDFPDMNELLSETSLWFMNNEPLIEFPRPMIHKIIDIGGISVSTGYSQLNKVRSLSYASVTHYFRRGRIFSISVLRPFFYLSGLLQKVSLCQKITRVPSEKCSAVINDCSTYNKKDVLRKFPDVTFIWKYEKPEDKISDGIPNLIETTWVPQNDMLCELILELVGWVFSDDPRLSLFITHCGQGSATEATTAGIPLIVIPVLADQNRNAAVGQVIFS